MTHSKRWVVAPPITEQADRELVKFPPIPKQIVFNRGLATDAEAVAECAKRDLGSVPNTIYKDDKGVHESALSYAEDMAELPGIRDIYASPLLAKESERIYDLIVRLFSRFRRKKKPDAEVEDVPTHE